MTESDKIEGRWPHRLLCWWRGCRWEKIRGAWSKRCRTCSAIRLLPAPPSRAILNPDGTRL
jgi:hypothetical protein